MERIRTPNSKTRVASPKGMNRDNSRNLGAGTMGTSAWHDVLDVCKKGFMSKVEGVTDDLKVEIRTELQQAVRVLRKEVVDIILHRDTPLGNKMSELCEKIHKLELVASQKPPPPDMHPVLQEMREGQSRQLRSNEQLEQRLDKMAQVSDEISCSGSVMADIIQRLEQSVGRLEQKAEKAEDAIDKVSKMQLSLNSAANQIAGDLQRVYEQGQNQTSNFGEVLHGNFSEQMAEMHDTVMNLDLAEVHEDIFRSRRQLDSDMRTVLQEIARIQQALQLDFVQVLADKVSQDLVKAPVENKLEPQGENKRLSSIRFDESQVVAATLGASTVGSAEAVSSSSSGRVAPRKTIQSIGGQTLKRVREFSCQTDVLPVEAKASQVDPNMLVDVGKRKEKPKKKKSEEPPETHSRADQLARRAKEASMRPPYNVFDFYKEKGCAQAIAKHPVFENLTLFIVFVNALWMAIDSDMNPSALVIDSPLVFQIAENFFTGYFFIEIVIRFSAWKNKRNCLVDFWFVFDSLLVLQLVAETWILTLGIAVAGNPFTSGGTGTMTMIKMVRLLKLLKLSRLAKLLRAFPELVVIMKGIGFASRSVLVFFSACTVVVYVFAVALRQLLDGLDVGKNYFSSVPLAVNTLLLQAMFPESSAIVNELTNDWWIMWPIMICFLALVSITVMYMLVGVLVQVVGVVSTVEKESLTVQFLATEMRHELERMGFQPDHSVTKQDLEMILVDPKVAKIIGSVGVDVVIMCDMLDVVFEDVERKGMQGMPFSGMVELVLSMRGSNPATVKDTKEIMRVMKLMIANLNSSIPKKLAKEFEELRSELQDLRDEFAPGRGHFVSAASMEFEGEEEDEEAV
eukprot:TRINITY_DN17092_c0_g3_i1.p1 TRINITY_DN17092_c0_g3~~TRINITY_DN17092_c0_g3_i1.p1  ORF type:complete len:853 (-),score=209.16 TRINITY_DN17092_c0_g3_i1:61-2619(-)